MFHDYESMGWSHGRRVDPILIESYRGEDLVKWAGNIERQLQGFVKDAEQSRNEPYALKLTTFLNKVWRPNEITGSVNRETIEALLSGATVLAVDNWTYQNYFSVLRDRLRQIIASEEELPRGMDNQNRPLSGTSRGAGGPPLNPEFGPETEPPPGAGEGGVEVEPGMETEAPPPEGEGAATAEEENTNEFATNP